MSCCGCCVGAVVIKSGSCLLFATGGTLFGCVSGFLWLVGLEFVMVLLHPVVVCCNLSCGGKFCDILFAVLGDTLPFVLGWLCSGIRGWMLLLLGRMFGGLALLLVWLFGSSARGKAYLVIEG